MCWPSRCGYNPQYRHPTTRVQNISAWLTNLSQHIDNPGFRYEHGVARKQLDIAIRHQLRIGRKLNRIRIFVAAMCDGGATSGLFRQPACGLKNIQEPMRPNCGIDTGLGNLASHRNSAARIFFYVYGYLWIVNHMALAQLSFDCRFGFAAAEASQSNITDQRYRDASVAVHPSMLGKIRRAIHRNLDLITGSNHECRTIVLRSSPLF